MGLSNICFKTYTVLEIYGFEILLLHNQNKHILLNDRNNNNNMLLDCVFNLLLPDKRNKEMLLNKDTKDLVRP